MIDIRRNVLVTPYQSAWVGGPDHAQIPHHARVIWGDEAKDEFPRHLRDVSAPMRSGRYLYGGPLKYHFGHVMVDTIIRLWAFREGSYDAVVFPCLDMPEPPGWFYDIVAIFGLEPSHVLVVKAPTTFEELHFAEPGSSLRCGARDWYFERLKSLPLQISSNIPSDRLYFGRTHIIHKGTLMGESFFENTLRQNGFKSIHPETFNIHAQASMLAKARSIVFMEGSAIYSIELLRSTEAEIFMIPRRRSAVALFAPHIAPKAANFGILGDRTSIVRKPNRNGKDRPNSPSFTSRPHTIFSDLIYRGLIPNLEFDSQAFVEAERADTERYFS